MADLSYEIDGPVTIWTALTPAGTAALRTICHGFELQQNGTAWVSGRRVQAVLRAVQEAGLEVEEVKGR